MKHALTMNSCPFCGKNVFSNGEFDFRKSIYRILIKNGLEDEELMTKIVDDVSTSLRENIKTEDSSGEEVEVEAEEEEDDGLTEAERNAPSRRIPSDPRRTSAAKPEVKADHIGNAIREFENAQREVDEEPRVQDYQDEDGGEDIPFFEGTSNGISDKAEAIKARTAVSRPSFKSRPK